MFFFHFGNITTTNIDVPLGRYRLGTIAQVQWKSYLFVVKDADVLEQNYNAVDNKQNWLFVCEIVNNRSRHKTDTRYGHLTLF